MAKDARGRGLSETRLLFAHALHPGLLPVVAWLSPALRSRLYLRLRDSH